MPLFACSKCQCVENSALCNYWAARVPHKEPPLCSECDPKINKWHGVFTKRSAVGMLLDNEGYVWSQDAVNSGHLPAHKRIVGKVEPLISEDQQDDPS